MKKIALLLLFLAACTKKEELPRLPPIVTVAKPVIRDVPLYNQYVGHVEANQAVDIRAQVAGILTDQFFVEGQEVKAGDLLMVIDPRPFEADLAKTEADLAENIATLRQAKDKADRYTKLVQQEYVSQLDYDQYVTDVYTAEASVKRSQALVETSKLNLAYCFIRAPIDGVTSKLNLYVGNYVSVGDTNPILSLNQISPIKVSFVVPEKDLPQITELHYKNKLKTIALLQHRPFEGELFLIDNMVDQSTGTILLQSLFPNTDKALWPGEFVDVRLILEIQKNALLIPNQAIQIGQESSYVFVVKKDHTVEQRNVVTGQKEDSMTIVNDGLCPDDLVILEGQINLYPGAQVEIRQ